LRSSSESLLISILGYDDESRVQQDWTHHILHNGGYIDNRKHIFCFRLEAVHYVLLFFLLRLLHYLHSCTIRDAFQPGTVYSSRDVYLTIFCANGTQIRV
jgi:hypothetical protein